MRKSILAGWLVLFSSTVFGQRSGADFRFDVVSIRPAASRGGGGPKARRGGPGTDDPERISYTGVSQQILLTLAYGVDDFQVLGPPWLPREGYDIVANVPAGATKEQFKIMLQNMLKERFNLSFHHEMRETAVYELVVGKDGPKLKAAVEVKNPPEFSAMTTDKDGHPDFPAGSSAMGGKIDTGVMRMAARMYSMPEFAHLLKDMVDRPILDKTGLTGNYDFKLDFSFVGLGGMFSRMAPAEEPTGTPSLFSAFRINLGSSWNHEKTR
jgi:uncharacterized protein (TIGR03435 family)